VSSFAAVSAAAFTVGGKRTDTGRPLGVASGGRPIALNVVDLFPCYDYI